MNPDPYWALEIFFLILANHCHLSTGFSAGFTPNFDPEAVFLAAGSFSDPKGIILPVKLS